MHDKRIMLMITIILTLLGIMAVGAIGNTQNSTADSGNDVLNDSYGEYMKIEVNGKVLNVKLENNEATKNLIEKLKNGAIKINAKEYGGFEKVGDLGFSLPTNDTYIKTSPGDLVLYQGNQVSLFYNSNSWNYTKLGEVQNVSETELKNILGIGDVELVLSL